MDNVARLLLKRSLTPEHAAQAAGYSNRGAFAKAFTSRYLASPEDFHSSGGSGQLRMRYGGAFDNRMTLEYLARDSENQAEIVEQGTYTRYFPLGGRPVKASLLLERRHWTMKFPSRLSAPKVMALHRLATHMLGLGQPLARFRNLVRDHPVLGPLALAMPGVRIIQTPSLWEALSWAILGQQINLAFAYKLRNRLIYLAGGFDNPRPRPIAYPAPSQLLELDPERLRQAQFSRQKIEYLYGLAKEFESSALTGIALAEVSLDNTDPGELETRLLAIRGLGPWTVAYGMMRGLGHLDALPVGDAGLRQALRIRFNLDGPPDAAAQESIMEPFRPYRSLATYYLWKSLAPKFAQESDRS